MNLRLAKKQIPPHLLKYFKPVGFKPKDEVDIPNMVAEALREDGWYRRCTIIWSKPNPMPESVTDRPTKAHEYVFLLSKSPRYYYDAEAIREPSTGWNGSSFTDERDSMTKPKLGKAERIERDGRNRRTVWTINTAPYKGAHFATFPPKLVEPMVLAGTSERGCCSECGAPYKRVTEKPDMSQRPTRAHTSKTNTEEIHLSNNWGGYPKSAGQAYQNWRNANPDITTGWRPTCNHDAPAAPCVVLDPFCGSGTVGAVCVTHNRSFIGIELNPAYIELAHKRISSVAPRLLA